MNGTAHHPKGFTLMELLVVVAIIGILAAIAVPQFGAYRQRGFDARAEADLRNAATAQEARYAQTQAYLTCTNADCVSGLPGFKLSDGVTLSMTVDGDGFNGTASHAQGSTTWNYSSAAGGITN